MRSSARSNAVKVCYVYYTPAVTSCITVRESRCADDVTFLRAGPTSNRNQRRYHVKKSFVEVVMKYNITKYIDRCNTLFPASLNLVMIHINGDSFELA